MLACYSMRSVLLWMGVYSTTTEEDFSVTPNASRGPMDFPELQRPKLVAEAGAGDE